MTLHSVTTLHLAALLVLQSVVPCCAISNLLSGDDSSDVTTFQTTCPCSCCPHSPMEREQVPLDDNHLPDGKCPFCGGLLLHTTSDDVIAPVTEGHSVFALLSDAPECAWRQASTFHPILQRQVLGHPFLNTSMRLLI